MLKEAFFSKVSLGSVSTGKQNNLNLIRFIAAYLVLFAHSYPIALGAGANDNLSAILGMSVSELAVNIFFVLSGFLVTGSLLARNNAKDFLLSRILRIYPALIGVVILTVFVLGVLVTTVSLKEYFSSELTYKYLTRNSFLLSGVKYNLPGVFTENVYPSAVNGSLWTLPIEVKLYVLLLLFYLLCIKLPFFDFKRIKAFKVLILGFCVYYFVHLIHDSYVLNVNDNGHRLFFLFLLGSFCNLFKDKLFLSWYRFLMAGLLLLIFYGLHRQSFFLLLYMLMPVLIFTVAYLLKGKVLQFNRLGDYSYGVYLYAFPIQQLIELFLPNLEIELHIFYSSVITIFLATLSWHFVEKPFVGMKKRL